MMCFERCPKCGETCKFTVAAHKELKVWHRDSRHEWPAEGR